MARTNISVEGQDGILHVHFRVSVSPELLAVLTTFVTDPVEKEKIAGLIATLAASAAPLKAAVEAQQAP